MGANIPRSIILQTKIEPADFTAFDKHVGQSAAGTRPAKAARGFLLIILIGGGAGFVASQLDLSLQLASFFIGTLAGMLYLSARVKAQARAMYPAPDGTILAPQEIQIAEEGIRVRSESFESFYRWSAVHRIEETNEHIFIMVDRIAGIIIPKRVFASEAEREQFQKETSGKPRNERG